MGPDEMMTQGSATEGGIPLCHIPHVNASQIHKQGEDVCHTSEKRVNLYYYNITFRKKSPKRELRARRARNPPSRHEPADNRVQVSRDHDSGDAP
jgi:hypothetical protein